MSDDLARLRRWLVRAQPPRLDLLRALLAGFIATATNLALLAGAVALLVDSASRPGLRAVALALVVIELFAFLRSPLRYAERLAAHQLGFRAVSRWRRWLVLVVGQLDYSQWRRYASGDLLERALSDTDELQDLWLRFVIPFIDVVAVMALGDIVVALLPASGSWWPFALNLAAAQLIGVVALCALAHSELQGDRDLRRDRGDYRAQLVELSAAAPELALLGRRDVAEGRLNLAQCALDASERGVLRRRRRSSLVVALCSILALAALASHPSTSPVWLCVAAVVAWSTYEALGGVRMALRAAVEVSGGGERLEALAAPPHARVAAWAGATLRLDRVRVDEGNRILVREATFAVAPGQHVALVGESGVGKSTLLRALASLDGVIEGAITLGDVELGELREDELRRRVAYVASEPGLTRGFALDVVTLGRPTTRDPSGDLAALGVIADRTTRFEELSRGERARIAIVRSLVTSPDLILLDEPTAGLGRDETRDVLALLSTQTATVIVATHDDDVMAWCDVVIELSDGELFTR
jgi:ABC-type transport system involved in cytochrome bd biosynthesis fused ATPase/permease subunit